MNYPELIFVGHTNIDVNITPHSNTVLPGGAAYFGALAASRIIQPVGLVTRIGNDFDPTFLLQHVLPEGVHKILDKQSTTSTNIYFSDTDLTDRDMKLTVGVSADVAPDDFPKDWLSHAKYIHISTMPPLQQYPFINFLRDYAPQAKLSIDTDIYLLKDDQTTKLVERNLSLADIVFANRVEYKLLKDVIDRSHEAIVKMDEEGAMYMKDKKIISKASAKKVSPIDVTGAGDIFAGTFLACLTKGEDIEICLQEATNAATESVTQEGIAHLF